MVMVNILIASMVKTFEYKNEMKTEWLRQVN